MNIGEKIRSMRVAKLMTQSELAGNKITRNMLSCIENGSAQPSLSTVVYIAGRLNVPVGFLLAEEGDEIVYQKMNSLANIKRAYKTGDLSGCRALCLSACPEPDDEIRLLLAICDAGIACEAFRHGKLRLCCRYFDEALRYAAECLYPLPQITAQAAVYFGYMETRISPMLTSDVSDGERLVTLRDEEPFARYARALDALDEGDDGPAVSFLSEAENGGPRFYVDHLRARCEMAKGGYKSAKTGLLRMLNGDAPLDEVGLYAVLCDLEICCRETEDFKGAYRYTNEKVQLLEQLLKEN